MCIHDTAPQDLAYRAYNLNPNYIEMNIVSKDATLHVAKIGAIKNSIIDCHKQNRTNSDISLCQADLDEMHAMDGGVLHRTAMTLAAQYQNVLSPLDSPVMKPKGCLLQFISFFLNAIPYSTVSNTLTVKQPSCNDEVSPGLARFFTFPMASAAVPHYRHHLADWDEKDNVFTINNEMVKATVFDFYKKYMVERSMMNEKQGEQFESDWRMAAAGVSLYIYIDEPPDTQIKTTRVRAKRVNREQYIADHITASCAYEEEIYNAEGENIGKQLIVSAQDIEDPLRRIFGETAGTETSLLKGAVAKGSRVVFFIFTTGLTLGLMPAAQRIYASILRRRYYIERGDKICAERQNRLIIAEVGTSLMLEGIPYRSRGNVPRKIPQELIYTVAPEDRAALYIKDKNTNIERELLIKVENTPPTASNSANDVFLKPTQNGDVYTHQQHADGIVRNERKVIYNQVKNEWHYDDEPNGTALNIKIWEGKKRVQIGEHKYEIHMPVDGEYRVLVKNKEGVLVDYHVYQEQVTKEWHLAQHNGHAVFTQKQKDVIQQNKLTPDICKDKILYPRENMDPERYGHGMIYEVRNAVDDQHSTPLYSVIEINGEIMKVNTVQADDTLKYYVVSHSSQGKTKRLRLAWEGERWVFERVRPPSMPKNLGTWIRERSRESDPDIRTLSSPDQHDLRWNVHGRAYMKIDGKFVRFWPSRLDKNLFSVRNNRARWNVVFEDGRYHIETLRKRLFRLKTVGLSGRGAVDSLRDNERSAIDVIQHIFGLDAEGAKAYLAQYRFQPHGLYNEKEFVRYIEQYDRLPAWAERFKVDDEFSAISIMKCALNIDSELARQYLRQYRFESNGPHSKTAFVNYLSHRQALPNWAEPFRLKGVMEHLGEIHPVKPGPDGKKIALGEVIGNGQYGITFVDTRDPMFVVKRLRGFDEVYSSVSDTGSENTDASSSVDSLSDLWNSALDEVDLFQRYYGIGTAEAIVEDGQVYIRMIKIPGKPLHDVQQGEFAEHAVEHYVDMLERLAERGIMHMDLHDGNILYHDGEFYPIDLSNNYDSYFYRMGESGKATDNMHTERQFNSILANIKAKQRQKADDPPVQRGG